MRGGVGGRGGGGVAGRGGFGGGRPPQPRAGATAGEGAEIPPAWRNLVQLLKGIRADRTEAEIYSTLLDCAMDPDVAFERLTSQDPFLEVRKKQNTKKEVKPPQKTRPWPFYKSAYRGPKAGSGPSGRFSSVSGDSVKGPTKKESKLLSPPNTWTSDSVKGGMDTMSAAGNLADAKFTSFQLPQVHHGWGGVPGRPSLAYTVKMGTPQAKSGVRPVTNNAGMPKRSNTLQHKTKRDVIIPCHLQVSNTDVAHLKFGGFGYGMIDASCSKIPSSNDVEVASASDNQLGYQSDVRIHEFENKVTTEPATNKDISLHAMDFESLQHKPEVIIPVHIQVSNTDLAQLKFGGFGYGTVDKSCSKIPATNDVEVDTTPLHAMDFESLQHKPEVIIPVHIQVSNTDLAQLKFGGFGYGTVDKSCSKIPATNDVEVASASDNESGYQSSSKDTTPLHAMDFESLQEHVRTNFRGISAPTAKEITGCLEELLDAKLLIRGARGTLESMNVHLFCCMELLDAAFCNLQFAHTKLTKAVDLLQEVADGCNDPQATVYSAKDLAEYTYSETLNKTRKMLAFAVEEFGTYVSQAGLEDRDTKEFLDYMSAGEENYKVVKGALSDAVYSTHGIERCLTLVMPTEEEHIYQSSDLLEAALAREEQERLDAVAEFNKLFTAGSQKISNTINYARKAQSDIAKAAAAVLKWSLNRRRLCELVKRGVHHDTEVAHHDTGVAPAFSTEAEYGGYMEVIIDPSIPTRMHLMSAPFEAYGYSWKIHCYPNGFCPESEGYVSLFLSLELDEYMRDQGYAVRADFSFHLLDEFTGISFLDMSRTTRKELAVAEHEGVNFWLSKKYGNVKVVRLKFLPEHFTIRCVVHVDERSLKPSSGLPLLESGCNSDVDILVGGERYAAHQFILSARSPVFCAAFCTEMQEIRGTYAIEDMSASVFHDLLKFMYGDHIPGLHEKPTKTVQEILIAADRFLVQSLKLICEDILVRKAKSDHKLLEFARNFNCDRSVTSEVDQSEVDQIIVSVCQDLYRCIDGIPGLLEKSAETAEAISTAAGRYDVGSLKLICENILRRKAESDHELLEFAQIYTCDRLVHFLEDKGEEAARQRREEG